MRGIIVPEFYGLYRSDGWALLILEDASSTVVDDFFDGLSELERYADASGFPNELISLVSGTAFTAPCF
jgi:hypothetical protein